MQPIVRVAGLGHALPSRLETVMEIEERIRREAGRLPVPAGILASISGLQTRTAVGPDEHASTLAAAAGRRAMEEAGWSTDDVDLVIFASTSQDQIEPATGHIVAHELGIGGGSVFDVKNACNSFVDGIRVAEGLVATGNARRALVVTGETPTLAANYAVRTTRQFRDSFIGFTVGDAGGAVALEPSDDARGVFYSHVWSASQHWDVTGVPGGGSRHPRGDEYLYARGDGGVLRDIVRGFDAEIATRAFGATSTTVDDYALFVIHQVTGPFTDEMIGRLGLPADRVARTIERHGNIAAATFPVAVDEARQAGRVRRGDRVMFVGLGAGISVATLALTL